MERLNSISKPVFLLCTINSFAETDSRLRIELGHDFAIISSAVVEAPSETVISNSEYKYDSITYPALIPKTSGIISSSPIRLLPQFPQNDRLLIFPESPGISNVFGVPLRSLNWARGTIKLEEEVAPHHFWHAWQWHRAVIAGSPIRYLSVSNANWSRKIKKRMVKTDLYTRKQSGHTSRNLEAYRKILKFERGRKSGDELCCPMK